MQIEPQIRFRGMPPSDAVEAAVRERIDRLARFHDRITSCTVVIEAPHRTGQKGKIYHVHVDITVPGTEIFVGREREENHAHEDVYVAIRDSFNAAQRKLEDVVRKMSRHGTKPHPEKLRGTIARLVCRRKALASSPPATAANSSSGADHWPRTASGRRSNRAFRSASPSMTVKKAPTPRPSCRTERPRKRPVGEGRD